MKLILLRIVIAILLLTGLTPIVHAQVNPGDLLFTGVNTFDDNTDGSTQDDAFSFVLLRDCPANTTIYFTDLGWTSSGFQSLSCGAGNGSQTDGIISWNSGPAVIKAGQQVVITCKYNLWASAGVVTGIAATQASQASAQKKYVSLGLAGDQLFAFTGSTGFPTFIAGLNINKSTWEASLDACEFSSSKSMLPGTFPAAQIPNITAVNGRYNCSITAAGSMTYFQAQLLNTANWMLDNTMSKSVPITFDLKKIPPCPLLVAKPDANGILYVNNQSVTPGDGSSWTAPLLELRDALGAATDPATNIKQIWVAKGTYKPTVQQDQVRSFVLVDNVPVYGGFAGNETTLADRNTSINPVILSGDIDNNDRLTNKIVLRHSDIVGANSYHVVTVNSGTATLDGVIITGGSAKGSAGVDDKGAGVYMNGGTLVINNTKIYGNTANDAGGAAYLKNGSVITLFNSVLFGNQAIAGSAIFSNYSIVQLTNVSIGGNSAFAVQVIGGSLTTYNSIITGNNYIDVQTYVVPPSYFYSIVTDIFYKERSPSTSFVNKDFTDIDNGDLSLKVTSPLINRGDPQTNTSGYRAQAGDFDVNYQTRIKNDTVDIGAYEYQSKPQVLTFNSFPTTTYGDDEITPDCTSNGDGIISYTSANPAIASIEDGKIKIKAAGTVVITAKASSTNGYEVNNGVDQTLVINKKNITVTAEDKSRPYNTVNPTFTSTYSAFAYNDNATVVNGTVAYNTLAATNSPAGEYAINVDVSGLSADNYSFTGNPGKLTVAQLAQTINFTVPTEMTYGDAQLTLTKQTDAGLDIVYTVTGPASVTGNVITITGATGPVTINASQPGNINYLAATPVSKQITIKKASLTYSATNKNRLYNQPDPVWSYTVSGFVNNETEAVISGAPSISTAATSSDIPGDYTILITAGTLNTDNYDLKLVNGTLTINKLSQTIDFPALGNKVYGAAAIDLPETSDGSQPLSYTVTGPATLNGYQLSITGVGTVIVKASQTGNNIYEAATQVTRNFDVTAAELILRADNKAREYNQNNPALSYQYSGFVNGDDVNVLTGTVTLSVNTDLSSIPGTYPITVSSTMAAANYRIITVPGVLTISAAQQFINFPVIADQTYGDAAFTLNATSGSSLAVAYQVISGPATINSGSVNITGAGTIVIAADQVGNGNYSPATRVTRSFEVGKALLTVTANNQTKAYKQPNPALDYEITGFKLTDTKSVVSGEPAITTDADETSIPGAYTITVTKGTLSTANYDFAFTNGSLTVGKASQAITFPVLTDKIYGDASITLNATSNSALSVGYTVTGPATLNGNVLTVTGVGTVSVTAEQAGDGNYTAAASVSRSFEVAKAPLKVKVDNKTREYNQNNPALTYQYEGFVNNENEAVLTSSISLSTAADLSSPPADYPIVFSGSVTGANYTISLVPGTLTVTTAQQAITFPAITDKSYGDADVVLNATASSSQPVVYSVVSGPAAINGNTLTITGAGTITIAADQPGNPNYKPASQVTRSFEVSKALLTVIAKNKTKAYKQPNPVLDYEISGFKRSDNASVVSGEPVMTVNADETSIPGTYTISITKGTLSAVNYDFAFTNGSLTVGKSSQIITFPALTDKTYGVAPVTLSATSNSGLQVAYTVTGPATLNGNILTITGAGTVNVTAEQSGDGNYNAGTSVSRSFEVAKAPLKVKVDNKTREYNQNNPAFTYQYEGFVNNESEAVLISSISLSTAADLSSPPADYPIVFSGSVTGANYTISLVPGTLTVTTAQQAITFPAITDKSYGDADVVLNATASSSQPVVYSIVSGPAAINGNTLTITGAGTVTIAANQPGNANYKPASQVTRSFEVSKALLTVTAKDKTKAYKQPNPVLDYEISGFKRSDNASVVSGEPVMTVNADETSIPGTYTISITKGTLSAVNYDFAFTNGSLTVGKSSQIITFPALTDKTYGVAPVTLSATSNSGLQVAYTVTGPATLNGNILTITGAGTVNVTAEQSGDGNYNAPTSVSRSFEVAKAPLKVKANNKTREYNQANPSFTYHYEGFVNNESEAVLISSLSLSTAADLSSPPADYPIVFSGSVTGANYTISLVPGTLTVTTTQQSITFPAIGNKTYGSSPVVLTATAGSNLPIAYTVVSGPATVDGNILTITGSGQVTIAANQAGNGNYNPAAQQTQSFLVNKAQLTITANNQTRKYKQANPVLDYTVNGFVGTDNSSVLSGNATISTNADINSPVGAYTINITTGTLSAANYDLNFVNGVLNITPASQTISFAAIPDKKYGDEAFELSATSDAGLPVTLTVTGGPASISGSILTITGAGTVTVTATQNGDNNYTAATLVSRSFNISKASLEVNADDKQRAFGAANPVFTYTATGFVYNDDKAVLTGAPAMSTQANTGSEAGVYPIVITPGNLSAANYTFTFVNGKLNVGQIDQVITFPSVGNKTYGDAAFTLNASSNSGLPVTYTVIRGPATVNGTTVTITGAGTVNIAANQPGNGSYNQAPQVSSSFNVAKAVLTITAIDKNKAYNQPVPVLGYSITGFVYNDNKTVVTGLADIGTIANVGSTPGVYPIVVTNGGLTAANYTFRFVDGKLTITKAAQQVTVNGLSQKTYGDVPFTVNGQSDSHLPVTLTVSSGPATINGNVLTVNGIGTVTVTATQNGDANYNAATPVSEQFTVAPAVLQVKADNKQRAFGLANPALTFTISGFVNNEDNRVVSGAPVLNTNATVTSVAGRYPINITSGNLNAANYTFNLLAGVLTVGPVVIADQQITFPAISDKTYGDPAFNLQATASSALPVSYTVVSGPATINGNRVTITGAGSVTIAANQAGDADFKPAPAVVRSFNVAKAVLTITAIDKNKAYNQPVPVLDYNITGFVYNDNKTVVTGLADISTIANVSSAPGIYPIVVTTGSLIAANYTFRFVDGKLTVAKAAQQVTVNGLSQKTYGDVPFIVNGQSDSHLPVTLTVSSGPAIINGNILTINGAGTITVTATQNGDANYNAATPVSQHLTVEPAVLQVKADNKQRAFGLSNPALTYTISGFVNNEDSRVVSGAPVLNTNATVTSVAGRYPINITSGNLNAANYTFNLLAGTLTVGPVVIADQQITFPTISDKTYGDPAFNLQATASSALPVSYTVVSGPATINGNRVAITGAGSVTIAANQAGDADFKPAPAVVRSFNVAKAVLTVTAKNDTRTYTGNTYTGGNGVEYTGFINPADETKLGGPVVYSGTSQGAVDAGSYVIKPGGISSNDYTLLYVNGILTINRAAQQITFIPPGNKNIGAADFMLNATSNSGLPVSFRSNNQQVIDITGVTGRVGVEGTAIITASQAGNNNYEPAVSITQTIIVTAYASPVITVLGNTVFCQGGSVKLESSQAPGYEWYRNNVLIPNADSRAFTASQSGTYTVKAIYPGNVKVTSEAVAVTVNPLPDGDLQVNGNTTISKGETIQLVASGGISYNWTPATGLNDPAINAPVARPAETTTYQVAITNATGCTVNRSVTITVKEDYKLESTNILTPNGDGRNDVWVVKNIDMYPQNEVKIFDRTGRIIFRQRGYTNNWNGTVNGNRLAEGTYYYIIDLGENKPLFKGYITIIHEK